MNKNLQLDGAHKKGRLETELHRRVIKSTSTEGYQEGFKGDWLVLYHAIYKVE